MSDIDERIEALAIKDLLKPTGHEDHGRPDFTGTIISATAYIPNKVVVNSHGRLELKPRHSKSAPHEILKHLSSMSKLKHTIVGWTGEVLPSSEELNGHGSSSKSLELARGNHSAGENILITKENRRELEALLEHALEDKIIPVWLGDSVKDKKDTLALVDQDRWHKFTNEELRQDLQHQAHESKSGSHVDTKFQDYLRMNEAAADAITKVYMPGDLIWIHDYEFVPLAAILRVKLPSAHIGYFHYDDLAPTERLLEAEYQKRIMDIMLGASVIGVSSSNLQKQFEDYYRNKNNVHLSSDSTISYYYGKVRLCHVPLNVDVTDTQKAGHETDKGAEHSIATFCETFLRIAFASFVRYPVEQSRWLPMRDFVTNYHKAPKRLFMFDYDGTLTPIVNDPEAAIPTEHLLSSLIRLASDPRNNVWIISGRDRAFLIEKFGHIKNIGFSAEHGCFICQPGSDDWKNLAAEMDMEWKLEVEKVFEQLVGDIPNSRIERKEVAMVWHYRNATDHEACLAKAVESKAFLQEQALKAWDVDVMLGKANLEVRPRFLNKGVMAESLVEEVFGEERDVFVLCAGDDTTDEDMFRALLPSKLITTGVYSCLISKEHKPTLARYKLNEPTDLVDAVAQLTEAESESSQ